MEQEPLFSREGLFRQKLDQLRKTGHIRQTQRSEAETRLKELEQGDFLTNVKSTLEDTDPKEMERLTLLDNTTQLYNHNTVTRILTDELKRSKRYKHDCTIILLLVDDLYSIQQTRGHDVSDTILKGVADYLMKEVRDVDIPARFSAEQLLIVCPETPIDGTKVLAERIRTRLPLERVSDLGQNWHVTASMGVASYPTHAETPEELIEKATEALDASIDSGGNCISITSTK